MAKRDSGTSVHREDFRQVRATPEEVEAYALYQQRRYGVAGRRPSVPRAEHIACGTRIWYSGMGIGSHVRACRGKHEGAA